MPRSRLRLHLLAAGLFLTACTPDGPVFEPEFVAPSPANASGVLGQSRFRTRGFEDEILALDSIVGGVGGVFVDERGNLVISVTDAVRASSASAALQARFPASHSLRRADDGGVSTAVVRSRFSDVVSTQRWVESQISRIPGVISTDSDERANAVSVGVADERARVNVEQAIASREVRSATVVVFLRSRPTLAGNLKDTWRPTRGGIQIHFPYIPETCSLGLNVVGADGFAYFLTASHCSHDYLGGTGFPVHQNNASASNRIGSVTLNPAWNVVDVACGTSRYCRGSDAMMVRYDPGISSPAKIAKTASAGGGSAGSIDVTGWWDAVPPSSPPVAVGQVVGKMGKTSGWTEGALLQTCVNLLNVYPTNAGVLCVNEVAAFASGGDSGGPVFRFQPPYPLTSRTALGILFASFGTGINARFWYSPLEQIVLEIGPISF